MIKKIFRQYRKKYNPLQILHFAECLWNYSEFSVTQNQHTLCYVVLLVYSICLFISFHRNFFFIWSYDGFCLPAKYFQNLFRFTFSANIVALFFVITDRINLILSVVYTSYNKLIHTSLAFQYIHNIFSAFGLTKIHLLSDLSYYTGFSYSCL
jgi:hypothetical protein